MNVAGLAAIIEIPPERWGGRCHEISLAIVRRYFPPGKARVARGWCQGVPGQHSWVVTGYRTNERGWPPDCYDPSCPIIDATLWSYLGEEPQVWEGTLDEGRHVPHGAGSIWEWGRPALPTGEPVTITPPAPWSQEAVDFLNLLGPLDDAGWRMLCHAPVQGWPAGEIFRALYLGGYEHALPIDIVGMATDLNPSGLYLRGDS